MTSQALPKHLRLEEAQVGARTARAFDLLRGRPVALKSATTRQQAAGLVREWRFLWSLSHRFVPEPVEFVRQGERQAYLTAGWIDALPLDRFLLQADAAGQAAAVLDALAGLDHLHAAGICHRDIRARNLLILQGESGPRARWLDLEHAVTEGSLAAGTWHVTGRPPGEDRGSDVFNPQNDVESFCVVLGKILEKLPEGPAVRVLREFAGRAKSVFYLDEMPHARAAWTICRELLLEAKLPVPVECTALGVARWVPPTGAARTWESLVGQGGERPRAVLVYGPAGVGKRRFLSHAAAELAASGARVVDLLGVKDPDLRHFEWDAADGSRRVALIESTRALDERLRQQLSMPATLVVVASDSDRALAAEPWRALGFEPVHWAFEGFGARDWYRWIAASV